MFQSQALGRIRSSGGGAYLGRLRHRYPGLQQLQLLVDGRLQGLAAHADAPPRRELQRLATRRDLGLSLSHEGAERRARHAGGRRDGGDRVPGQRLGCLKDGDLGQRRPQHVLHGGAVPGFPCVLLVVKEQPCNVISSV